MDKVYTLYEEHIEPFDVLSSIHTGGIIYSLNKLRYNEILVFSLFDKFVTIENKKNIKLMLEVNNANKRITRLYNKYVKETFRRK